MTAFLPMCFIAWPRPTVVVVLPSPSGVGVMAVTTTYLAFGRSLSSSIASRLDLGELVAVRLEQVRADAHLGGDVGERRQRCRRGRSRDRTERTR